MKFTTLIASLLLLPAGALDIIMQAVTCDQSLAIYAESLTMTCEGSNRCTFGNSATINGTLVYNGTEAAGITNHLAYATAELAFVTLTYHLFEDLQIDLCQQSMTAVEGNANKCPGDGKYSFDVAYVLPTTADSSSWLATGWTGTGEIAMYSQKSNLDSLVGYCTFALSTAVTVSASKRFNPPSASTTTGLVLGFVALAVLASVYFVFRRRASSKRLAATNNGNSSFIDDAKTHLTSNPEIRVS